MKTGNCNNILQNFKDSVAQAAMGKLEEVNTQLAQSNVSQMQLQSLYAYNQNIAVMNDMERNWQAVNDIIIDVKVNNKKKPDSLQLEYLKDLAWKCPFIEGKSVYQSRVMLSYYDDLTVMYFNSCEYELKNDSKRMAAENEEEEDSVIKPFIIVFPNPASTTLTIDITCSDYNNAEFIIYNTLGQEVMIKTLDTKTKSILIDISKIETGFYNYFVRIDNKLIKSDKLIIIR